MLESLLRQIKRLRDYHKEVTRAQQQLREMRRVPYHGEEGRLWRRLQVLVADCEYELQWLADRLRRAEVEKEREVISLVERERQRQGEAAAMLQVRHNRPTGVRLDPQRLFSPLQKQEIYLRANGQCCACGTPLDSDWHADHVVPHSRGGRTELVNAQALCQPCNSRKSAKVLTVEGGG